MAEPQSNNGEPQPTVRPGKALDPAPEKLELTTTFWQDLKTEMRHPTPRLASPLNAQYDLSTYLFVYAPYAVLMYGGIWAAHFAYQQFAHVNGVETIAFPCCCGLPIPASQDMTHVATTLMAGALVSAGGGWLFDRVLNVLSGRIR